MNTLGDRIKAARIKHGLSQVEAAEALGITGQAFGRWEHGKASPRTTEWIRLAQLLDVSLDSLLLDKCPEAAKLEQMGYKKLPVIDAPNAVDHLIFKTEWLERNNLDPENCCLLEMSGRQMERTLFDGDVCLVDLRVGDFVNSEIYALKFGDIVLIRRLIRDPIDGRYTMMADNSRLEPARQLTVEESQKLTIVGRIAWIGSTAN